MQLEIRNGHSKIYNHRHYFLSMGMKFNKRKYGKSFYSKKVTVEEKEELILYCKRHGLKFSIIDDAYIRDSHYRKEFLQTKKHEWTICAYCGLPKRTKNITVDHIIPVDKVKKSQYAKWLLKIFHIDNVNDKKNLAGACRKCNSKKGTKMGLWVLRGFIGKSSVVWIVRWILRLVIFLLCVMAACNIGICHAAAGEMEESDVLNSNEPIIEESVIEKVPIIDSGVTIEANVLQNTIVQNIGGVDEGLIEKFTNSYMLIPENVRKSFQDNGWSIYATTENIGQKYYGRKMSILGLTVTNEKVIYIDDREKAAKTVIHEIGHYIDYSYNFVSSSEKFAKIFTEEVETFRSIHSTHENNTASATEYFAEFYLMAIINPDLVKNSCPRTYEFIMQYANRL